MTTTVRKGLIGSQDVNWYTAASPTFSRFTSTGTATTMTSVSATNIPIVQSAASKYFSQNQLQRAVNEIISRYFGKNHSLATFAGGAGVGDHQNVFSFQNALAATSIQAGASNQFLTNGFCKIYIPGGTYTLATPLQLPRNTILFGAGESTKFRANATIKTSRLFTMTGSVGGTTSNLTSNATVGTRTLTVSNGALFAVGQNFKLEDSVNSEFHTVRSIAGNTITAHGIFRHTYRSAATTKKITVAYPARLIMDNLRLSANNVTQGIGLAATILQNSYMGPGVTIDAFVDAAVKLNLGSQLNKIYPTLKDPASTTSRGVWFSHPSCHDNEFGGADTGVSVHVNDGGFNNFIWGNPNSGSAAASGVGNPLAHLYRKNKPELSSTTYAGIWVVACPASSTAPAEVMIDGRILKNSSTVLCDLTRTINFTAATVGGLDRGPATASKPFYIYAVPAVNSSATRQFTLVASNNDPASGLIASATYPSWSFLGAVIDTPTQLSFTQNGDRFNFTTGVSTRDRILDFLNLAATATIKSVTSLTIPVGVTDVNFKIKTLPTYGSAANVVQVRFYDGKASLTDASSPWCGEFTTSGGPSTTAMGNVDCHVNVPVNSSRRFGYRIMTGGSNYEMQTWLTGWNMPRANFK